MPSSRLLARLVAICATFVAAAARAQDSTGFAVDRYVPSAPGAGWLVLDDVAIPRRLQGALSVSAGYARNSFRVGSANVVAHDARSSVAGAIGFERVRLSFLLTSPLVVGGRSTYVQGTHYVAPSFDLAKGPDTLADTRLGLDVRVLGAETAPLRLGASAQLIVPSGGRHDYLSDDTYRGTGRLLLAGDLGPWAYAAHVGVHVRPHYQGHELWFGAGLRLRLHEHGVAVLLGPELFGETALRSMFGASSTGLEALLSLAVHAQGGARRHPLLQPRFKLGTGGGLHAQTGVPEWRIVTALELVAEPR